MYVRISCRECGRPTRLASNPVVLYESGLGVLGVHVIKLAMPAGNGGYEKPINPSKQLPPPESERDWPGQRSKGLAVSLPK